MQVKANLDSIEEGRYTWRESNASFCRGWMLARSMTSFRPVQYRLGNIKLPVSIGNFFVRCRDIV